MNLIGITGPAGAGKSTAAQFLVEDAGFVAIGLADVLKRFVGHVWPFDQDQIWGPSERRVEPTPVGVVVPDVRFDNEARAIRKSGGEVWSIRRDAFGSSPPEVLAIGGVPGHAFEVGVDPGLVSFWIENFGSREALRAMVLGRVGRRIEEES